MKAERLTVKNPDGVTYRLPLSNGPSFRQEWQYDQTVLFGTMVDKLGAYEDLGTPEEFRELIAKSGQIHSRRKGGI